MAGRRYAPLVRCWKIAATQHGVIGASQAVDVGLSRDGIRRLVSNGAWQRVRPSVFALWLPKDAEELWYQRLSSAAVWLGDAAAVSHRAAAVLWGLDGVNTAPLDFCTTGRRRSSEPGLFIHRVGSFASGDVVRRKGFRLTSVARTLVDLCTVTTLEIVELALESAVRNRLVSTAGIRRALDRSGQTQKGCGALRALLDQHPGRSTESELEGRVWRLLLRGGLPAPNRQYEVRSNGQVVARVDFAYPDQRIAIEADGFRFHTNAKDWRRERARQNALVRLGWTVYRITRDDALRARSRVLEDVSSLLARSVP